MLDTKTHYQRFGKFTLEEVLPHIEIVTHIHGSPGEKKEFASYFVNLDSVRLQTFKTKGTTCVACGLQASFFALEKSILSKDLHPHFNLYGVKEEEEVLFTKDHILPKALGGSNRLDNMQPMCSPCNSAKGKTFTGPPLVSSPIQDRLNTSRKAKFTNTLSWFFDALNFSNFTLVKEYRSLTIIKQSTTSFLFTVSYFIRDKWVVKTEVESSTIKIPEEIAFEIWKIILYD